MSDPEQSPCFDCGTATTPCSGRRGCRHIGKWEYYMVWDEIWTAAGNVQGFLCINCLEKRLGVYLCGADFTHAPINDPNAWDSSRLLDRKLS